MLKKLESYEDYIGHRVWCRDRTKTLVFSAIITKCDVRFRLLGGGADSSVTAVILEGMSWPFSPADVFESELEAYEDLQKSLESDLVALRKLCWWSDAYAKSLKKQLKVVCRRISEIRKEN